jgi:hypothetical protein
MKKLKGRLIDIDLTMDNVGILLENETDKSNIRYLPCKLLLKPISSISDEDAIEVANIYGYVDTNPLEHNLTNGKRICKELLETNFKKVTFSSDQHSEPLRFDAYQYLISKGYDLPNYHLGCSTLQESGLAIYEI